MRNILTIVLGGGAGTRLYPLTRYRAKPAVPLAGKYRLIDVAISNCINSNLKKIYVLTQYLSASLNRHVSQTYSFDPFQDGFVDILAAEQREGDQSWFQGTADAVRKHWSTIDNFDCDMIMILPGDALYRMDFSKMVEHHLATNADVTVAVNTVPQRIAHHFGLLKIDDSSAITEFREKPKTREDQAGLEAPAEVLAKFGLKEPEGDIFLASMGIYLFKREVLAHYLERTEDNDFGKQIIPSTIQDYRAFSYIFNGYWEDIGTIEAFYEAHMQFLCENPPFQFADPKHPIYTRARYIPSTRFEGTHLVNSVVAEGCHIGRSTINHSVVGLRSLVEDHTTIEDSILMGADFYEGDAASASHPAARYGKLGIGKYCHIRKAIVDKNARIGDNVKILNEKNVQHEDGPNYHIRDGIVIIPKNVVIEPHTVI